MKTAFELLQSAPKKIQQQGQNFALSEDARFGYSIDGDELQVNGIVSRGTKRAVNLILKGEHITYLTCTCNKASTSKLCAHAYAILMLVAENTDEIFGSNGGFDKNEDKDELSDEELETAVRNTSPLILQEIALAYSREDPNFREMLVEYCGGGTQVLKAAKSKYKSVHEVAEKIKQAVESQKVDSLSEALKTYTKELESVLEATWDIDIADDLTDIQEAIRVAWNAHVTIPKAIENDILVTEIEATDVLTLDIIEKYQELIIFSMPFESEFIRDPLLEEYKVYSKKVLDNPAAESLLHPTDFLRVLSVGEPEDTTIDFLEAEFVVWLPKLKGEQERLDLIHTNRMQCFFFATRYEECFAVAKLLLNREATKEKLENLFAYSDDEEVLEEFLKKEGW